MVIEKVLSWLTCLHKNRKNKGDKKKIVIWFFVIL